MGIVQWLGNWSWQDHRDQQNTANGNTPERRQYMNIYIQGGMSRQRDTTHPQKDKVLKYAIAWVRMYAVCKKTKTNVTCEGWGDGADVKVISV